MLIIVFVFTFFLLQRDGYLQNRPFIFIDILGGERFMITKEDKHKNVENQECKDIYQSEENLLHLKEMIKQKYIENHYKSDVMKEKIKILPKK